MLRLWQKIDEYLLNTTVQALFFICILYLSIQLYLGDKIDFLSPVLLFENK